MILGLYESSPLKLGNHKFDKIAERFWPGPLTLVLPLRRDIIERYHFDRNTIGFRISSDLCAQRVISDYMTAYDAPLTCTSANVSGMPTQVTPEEICVQFGERRTLIASVVDDGRRAGTPSTVVEVIDDIVKIHRLGAVGTAQLFAEVNLL